MTTTDTLTVACVYCGGQGTVWGGSIYSPPRRCLACDGSGRIAPLDCPLCSEPLLDDQSKVYSINGVSVTTDHRAVHLSCLPITPEEGQQ